MGRSLEIEGKEEEKVLRDGKAGQRGGSLGREGRKGRSLGMEGERGEEGPLGGKGRTGRREGFLQTVGVANAKDLRAIIDKISGTCRRC